MSRFAQGAMRRYPAIFEATADVGARLESVAGTLEGATDGLMARQEAYRQAVLSLIPLRIEVKLVDLRSDDVVRSIKRAAEEAGPAIDAAVFPGGITPIVRPFGRTEVTQLRALEGRIAAASGWAEREAQLGRATAARTMYEAALVNRESGMIAAADQRALRDAAKEDFLDAFAQVAAGIKQIFVRDRKRQDVFFDVLRGRRVAAEDTGGDDTDDGDDGDDV